MNFIYLLFLYLMVLFLMVVLPSCPHFALNYKNSTTMHFIKNHKNTKFYREIRLIDKIYILKYNESNQITKAKTNGS